MKDAGRFIVGWCIVFPLVLTACVAGGNNGSSDPGADKTCTDGVCAELNVAQPIILNQPANVTITISSTVDKPGLSIKLQASPTNVTFGLNTLWQYDAVANRSKVFTSTVTFTSPGGYLIGAEIFWKGSPLLVNQDRVVIDTSGATVNPTLQPRSPTNGYPVAYPPPSEVLTSIANSEAEVTITPPQPVADFFPRQWLEKCGWTVNQPEALSEWPNVSGWLNITETSVVGEQVNGTLAIGFKDEANPNTAIETRIGLCSAGQGWTTDASYEWNTELRSGIPFETLVSLRFTEPGDIPIFIVVLDVQNNRIAGIGRLIYVKPKE